MLYSFFDQEGLPDYWGIETPFCQPQIRKDYPTTGVLKLPSANYQEGLPDYWGIETCSTIAPRIKFWMLSGRITRLLGY